MEHAQSLGMSDRYAEFRVERVEIYQLIINNHPSYTSYNHEMKDILGRDLALPKFEMFPYIRDKYLKREDKQAKAERLVKEEVERALKVAEDQIRAEKEAHAAVAKANCDAFMLSIALAITMGSFHLKKLGFESTFRKRFIWVDYKQKVFCWSKVDDKQAPHKSRPLRDDSSSAVIEVVGEVISIKLSSGEASVDIKVSCD